MRVGRRRLVPALVLSLLSGAACSLPPVRVETPKPIVVDINMRVDVFQHQTKTDDPLAVPSAPAGVESRRRARMAEIQTLKNSRLVGEDHRGLLTIRDLPAGEYGQYVRETVSAENADRNELIEQMAKAEQKPVDQVRREVADLWRERSFPGEWIEVQGPDGTWTWVQKPEGEPAGAAAPAPPPAEDAAPEVSTPAQ